MKIKIIEYIHDKYVIFKILMKARRKFIDEKTDDYMKKIYGKEYRKP